MEQKQNDPNMSASPVCPGCGRRCQLSEPQCARGETFAETGTLPEQKERQYGECTSRGDRDGCRRERGGCGKGRDGCGKGRHAEPATQEQYGALPTEEKLFYNLHALMHAGKPGFGRGGQGRILMILAERERISQRELMDIVGIQSGSLSEVLRKLEDAGYLKRTQREDDRRSVDVCITESGREAAKQRKSKWANSRVRVFSALSEAEQQTLLSLLEKAAAGLRAQATDPETEQRGREGFCGRGHNSDGGCAQDGDEGKRPGRHGGRQRSR